MTFSHHMTSVNGIQLHYVIVGRETIRVPFLKYVHALSQLV
jgi:hypothetical protein